jgi:uncharacterized protein YjiS (DUF1127 family)
VVLSDDRGIARVRQTPAASSDFPELQHSQPTVPPEGTEADYVNVLYWSLFTMIVEGFAAYGAAMYPTAVSVESTLTAAKAAKPRSPACGLSATEHGHHINPQFENGNVVRLGRVAAIEATRRSRWNWLTSSVETFVTLWSRWRREREIGKAAAALAELDDRTLRDIGIHHRSQIDQAVRHGRDC